MFVSDKTVQRFLLVAFSIVFVLGFFQLVFASMFTAGQISANRIEGFKGFDKGSNLEASIVTSMFASLLELLTGVVGFIAALKKWRLLLMLTLGLLAGIIVLSVVILVSTVTSSKSMSKSNINEIKEKIIDQYGSTRDEASIRFSLSADRYQKQERCCGFSNDEGENLFIKSPWYTLGDKKNTLPDSCCIRLRRECREAKNLKEAREKQFVHIYDCVTSFNKGISTRIWTVVFDTIAGFLLQGSCIAGTLVMIINMTGQS
ncbi:hypothetical protein BOX15_Mlig019682g2 [Macrostomum lignano]|uniref:Tetraspanin n=1 Tax=Macrostomum lignano TaxID=282301 RepID=A0A267GZ03_9PLAT|nr:hypothetical protein BOX15_Mlig019682g2 [Macrostomum lignano]